MKKSSRNLLSIALILLLVAASGLIFAYWDQLTGSKDTTIEVGEGVTTEVSVVVEGQGKLVPATALVAEGDTKEITYTYTVKFNDSNKQVTDALQLNVALSNLKIGNNDDTNKLVNINIGNANLNSNTNNVTVDFDQTGTTIVVVVTLNEPASMEVYNSVKNQTITFTLGFTVSKK